MSHKLSLYRLFLIPKIKRGQPPSEPLLTLNNSLLKIVVDEPYFDLIFKVSKISFNSSHLVMIIPKSKAFKLCNTYKEPLKNIKDKDSFIYLDPPYIPNSNTSNFTDYSSHGFKQKDHIELGELFLKLVNSGKNVILSNNNNQLSRDIFLQSPKIYGYEVLVSKSINSKKTGRGKTSELLVSSFNLDELGLNRV